MDRANQANKNVLGVIEKCVKKLKDYLQYKSDTEMIHLTMDHLPHYLVDYIVEVSFFNIVNKTDRYVKITQQLNTEEVYYDKVNKFVNEVADQKYPLTLPVIANIRQQLVSEVSKNDVNNDMFDRIINDLTNFRQFVVDLKKLRTQELISCVAPRLFGQILTKYFNEKLNKPTMFFPVQSVHDALVHNNQHQQINNSQMYDANQQVYYLNQQQPMYQSQMYDANQQLYYPNQQLYYPNQHQLMYQSQNNIIYLDCDENEE